MSVTAGQKGLKLVESGQYADAIPLLTTGIDAATGHANPHWLLARALAHQHVHTDEPALALADAEAAFVSAVHRNPSDRSALLVDAQYRRAIAFGNLGRYADADACLVWSQQLAVGQSLSDPDPVSSQVDAQGRYTATEESARASGSEAPKGGGVVNGAAKWTRAFVLRPIFLSKMAALPADDPGRTITAKRVPVAPASVSTAKPAAAPSPAPAATPSPAPAATPTPTPTPAKPLRVDMIQTGDNVSLAVYAKGVDGSALEIAFESERRVRLSGLPEAVAGPTRTVTLVLGGPVQTGSQARVTAYKIELSLAKKDGAKWASWGRQVTGYDEEDDDETKETVSAPALTTAPAAPAVSAAPKKNWDELVRDVDDPADQDPNAWFKQLYANGTPENRRAMEKSFVESNGTSLSMDWNSVSKGPVEGMAPDGTKMVKWDA